MRVLFVTADHPMAAKTGFYSYSRTVLEHLSECGEVEIASLDRKQHEKGPGDIVTHRPRRNVMVRDKRLAQALSMVLPGSMVEWQFYRDECARWLSEVIEARKPDLILMNHLRSAWLVRLLEFPWRRRCVYLAHNSETAAYASAARLETSPAYRLAAWIAALKIAQLERDVLNRCKAAWCLSQEDRRELSEHGGSNIHLVPPMAVDSGSADDNPLRVFLVGSFTWRPRQKNAEWLASQVWPVLRSRIPGVRFDIIGMGAQRLGQSALRSGATVYSDVEDVRPYFQAGGIFLVPERQDGGVKLKTLEAASWGLPIVSTPEGIQGTPLRGAESCVVVETAAQFVDAVTHLVRNDSERRRLGEQAKRAVAHSHSRDAVRALFRAAFRATVTLIHEDTSSLGA
jgi:glycosyltransferase involved in cell wall biosynthesis